MAVYKVPQDVEADDKLIGPFSFRQFIYLIIVAASGAIAWLLSQIFIPLFIIPLPFILFFGALALPLRKDQPMETYLAALVSFYLKPHKRLWQPDGIQSLIEITVPKTVDEHRTKDLSQLEADKRLSYLANIVDSQGWAVRGASSNGSQSYQSSMNQDYYNEAQRVEDVLDNTTRESHSIDSRINTTRQRSREEMLARIQQPQQQPTQPQPQQSQPIQPQQQPMPAPTGQAQPLQPTTQTAPAPTAQQPILQSQMPTVQQQMPPAQPQPQPHLTINPYPSMQQTVLQPVSQPQPQPQQSQESTSNNTPSPDIMNLANNSDLSIETLAHEAKRIESKEVKSLDDEVSISLH